MLGYDLQLGRWLNLSWSWPGWYEENGGWRFDGDVAVAASWVPARPVQVHQAAPSVPLLWQMCSHQPLNSVDICATPFMVLKGEKECWKRRTQRHLRTDGRMSVNMLAVSALSCLGS